MNGSFSSKTAECVIRKDNLHAGDGDLSELSSFEYVVVDITHLVVEGDLACKSSTSCKCLVGNLGSLCDEAYAAEARAVLERLRADSEHIGLTGNKIERSKICTVFKCTVIEGNNPAVKGNGGKCGTVCKHRGTD